MARYTVELTEEELKAIGLIASYFKFPCPLANLDRDIAAEFGEVDFGDLDFDVYDNDYVNLRTTEKTVIIRWPKDWERAWHSEQPKKLKRLRDFD